MANSKYISGLDLTDLMVPTKAATVFAAQEASLYMSGGLVPMIDVPAGSTQIKVPKLAAVADPTVMTTEANPGVDIDTVIPVDSAVNIDLGLYATRSVVRDIGGISTDEIGRVLGNAIASAFDKKVTTQFASLTTQELSGTAPAGSLTVADIFNAVGTIRNTGETGELFGIVSAGAYGELMGNIGSSAFAGGEFQNSAMRNGFFGRVAGIPLFVSSYLNDTDMGTSSKLPVAAIMSKDAVKGAMQGGVKLEIARRPEAVGFDIVASVAMGASVIDSTRGVIIQDAS